MASVVEDNPRDPSEHEIVGHLFGKASPILTWSPAPSPLAARSSRASEPAVLRPSRATTRRMVAWPVVKSVGRERGRALRALFTLVTLSLLCGSALAIGIYIALGEETATRQATFLPSRVSTNHVAEATIDTLTVSSTSIPVETADPATPAVRQSAPPPRAASASTASRKAGRGHLVHREPAAPPLHAARAPAGGTRSNHGTT